MISKNTQLLKVWSVMDIENGAVNSFAVTAASELENGSSTYSNTEIESYCSSREALSKKFNFRPGNKCGFPGVKIKKIEGEVLKKYSGVTEGGDDIEFLTEYDYAIGEQAWVCGKVQDFKNNKIIMNEAVTCKEEKELRERRREMRQNLRMEKKLCGRS
jgi:hypothetical protein